MAYSTSNPPRLIDQDIGNAGPARWTMTGTDTAAAVDTSGYITNAKALGMKAGDKVEYTKTDATPMATTAHIVASITAGGAADLTDGSVIGSAINTD